MMKICSAEGLAGEAMIEVDSFQVCPLHPPQPSGIFWMDSPRSMLMVSVLIIKH